MAANPSPTSISSGSSGEAPDASVTLAPSYRLPIAIVLLALLLLPLSLWLTGAIALFGCFLLVQAATLRLTFTATALEVHRGDRLIRHFPYQDWQNWRIFWSPAPILFYFKEINSIHFLPMLFSASQLKAELERHQLPVISPPS